MGICAVTGANGHLGSNLVRALLARGDKVVALVRRGSDLRGLEGLPIETRFAELLDRQALLDGLKGCEVLFHVAAVHRNWSRDPADIIRPAVEGTRHAIDAAQANGLKQVVLTSSIATIGYTPDPAKPLSEDSHNHKRASAYIRGKCEAEALAFELCTKHSLPLVVACPSVMLGPYDYRLTPATRAFQDLVKGGPSVLGLNVVHVRDAADGHLLAQSKGRPGERYLIGGDNLLQAEVAERIARLGVSKPKVMTPPRWLLKGLSHLQVLGAKLNGKDPALTPDMVEDAGGRHLLYDISKARTELGFAPRDADAVLKDAVSWLLHLQAMPPKLAARLRDQFPPDPAWSAPKRAA